MLHALVRMGQCESSDNRLRPKVIGGRGGIVQRGARSSNAEWKGHGSRQGQLSSKKQVKDPVIVLQVGQACKLDAKAFSNC